MAKKLTLATTARTMGPKTIFISMSMMAESLDNRSRVRGRGSLASEGCGRGIDHEMQEDGREPGGGTGIKGGEHESVLPRYTYQPWDNYHIDFDSITYDQSADGERLWRREFRRGNTADEGPVVTRDEH